MLNPCVSKNGPLITLRGHAKGGRRYPVVFKEASGLPALKASLLAGISHKCVTFCQCQSPKRLRRWVTKPTVEPSQQQRLRTRIQIVCDGFRDRVWSKNKRGKPIDFMGYVCSGESRGVTGKCRPKVRGRFACPGARNPPWEPLKRSQKQPQPSRVFWLAHIIPWPFSPLTCLFCQRNPNFAIGSASYRGPERRTLKTAGKGPGGSRVKCRENSRKTAGQPAKQPKSSCFVHFGCFFGSFFAVFPALYTGPTQPEFSGCFQGPAFGFL